MKIVQDFMALLIYQMSIRSETKSLSSGQQFPKFIERSRADNFHASNRNRAKFELSVILWLSPLSASLMRTDKKKSLLLGQHFPFICLLDLLVAMETKVLTRTAKQNLIQPIFYSNYGTCEI